MTTIFIRKMRQEGLEGMRGLSSEWKCGRSRCKQWSGWLSLRDTNRCFESRGWKKRRGYQMQEPNYVGHVLNEREHLPLHLILRGKLEGNFGIGRKQLFWLKRNCSDWRTWLHLIHFKKRSVGEIKVMWRKKKWMKIRLKCCVPLILWS